MRWGFSIDGTQELNDAFRVLPNGKGTYEIFFDALKRWPDFVKSCGSLTTVTKNNQNHLLEVARHFRDLGIRSWEWTLFQPIGQGRKGQETFNVDYPSLLEEWDKLFQSVLNGEFDGMFVGPVASYLRNFIESPGANMCMRQKCGAARDLLSISSDGTIEACDTLDRKGPFSGLGLVQIEMTGSLKTALSSSTAEIIRSRDVTRNCSECIWLAVCGGTCLAYASHVHAKTEGQCSLSMKAFTRISESIATDDRLQRYWTSIT